MQRIGADPAWKYVGGKGWFLEEGHADRLFPTAEEIAARGGVYREPFAGAGAVALGRYAGRCRIVLSDSNAYLIRLYRVVRDQPSALIEALAAMQARYSRETFEAQREALNAGKLEGIAEAVAVLVILMWGYNGLWRVNGDGKINVPFGKPSSPGRVPRLFDPDKIRAVHRALAGAVLNLSDFEKTAAIAQAGDFVYIDPPYAPLSNTADFTGYAVDGFTYAADTPPEQGVLFDSTPRKASDLERLVSCCELLDTRGVQWALSNNDVAIIREAFGRWNIMRVQAPRNVSSKSTTRGPVWEVIVRNFGRS